MQHVDRQQQIFAALQIVHAVGEAIQELGSVPSGRKIIHISPAPLEEPHA
jgi:hypothetical protein